jgi:uncharacterized membrane protein
MKTNLPISMFVLVEIAIIVFILSTVGNLSENVASHFDGAGDPNGFMSRAGYNQFILLFAVGIPALIVCSSTFLLRLASVSINIPNKEYWLSAQNKRGTIQFLQGHVACLGMLIASFIAYVYWLVLEANSVQPPKLSNGLFFIGMGAFLISVLLWGLWLVVKFMRLPKD